MKKIIGGLIILLAMVLIRAGGLVQAATYWASVNNAPLGQGVRARDITVCFVGQAVSQRPSRVEQIIEYIKEFEYAANIRFITLSGQRLQDAFDTNTADLICPAPGTQPNGYDAYQGDIRVAIPNVPLIPSTSIDFNSPMPGYGCVSAFSDQLNSDPDAVSWGADRIDVVWRGSWDNALLYKSWTWVDGKLRWKSAVKLDGNVTSGPAIATLGGNDLHIFAQGADNGLWHRSSSDGGGNWSAWQSLSGSLALDPASNPAAISISANRLDVFVRWSDNSLRHLYSTDGGTTWSTWENLGGVLASSPAVASWGSNRIDLFARGQDNGLWHKYWNGSTWSGWDSHGGQLSSAPDAVSWGANRIDVVAKGNNNSLIHIAWDGSQWTGWQTLAGTIISGPTISSRTANSLDVFARSSDDGLWYMTYDGSGGGWGSWQNISNHAQTGSYSHSPWELDNPGNRSCLYNLRLGDNGANGVPYLNHTLHEFGHALGLSHEHQRKDATCYNPLKDERGSALGYMTPYDIDSVMHYKFSLDQGHTCDVNGNYDYTGLSYYDKLALHIMYPEDSRVAEFAGRTIIRTGETLNLQSAWKIRGANMNFVARNFVWKLNGVSYSTTPDLVVNNLSPGEYVLELTHDDFLDRSYAYTGKVRVLEPAAYDQLMANIATINQALLATDGLATHAVSFLGGSFKPAPGVNFIVKQGAFSGTVVMRYAGQPVVDTGSLSNIGLFYQLDAVHPLNGQPVQLQPGQTYAVELTYQPENVPSGVNEADLALYFWDEGQWVKENTSVVDVETNTITATPNHFSQWAVLADSEQPAIYLPLIIR